MPKQRPIPNKEGYYWAKLVHPREGTAKPEYWGQTDEDSKSVDWEVVQLHYDPNATEDEQWQVSVPGIELSQFALDCIWGPEVIKPEELK